MSVCELLERDRELTLLDEALHAAQAGTGSVVLVHGEAGIGKTSIVRAFARRLPDRVRLLAGACDDLVTPRTLGPLRDAVRGSGPLAAALAAGDRDALLADLDGGRPTVLVLEDVQWADDATLDVLRYLGRRVVDLPVVLVVTYRDDEVGPSLQRVLGGWVAARCAGGTGPALPRCGGPARGRHRGHLGSAVPAHPRQPVLRLRAGGRRSGWCDACNRRRRRARPHPAPPADRARGPRAALRRAVGRGAAAGARPRRGRGGARGA
jgi:AAA ATPase domain